MPNTAPIFSRVARAAWAAITAANTAKDGTGTVATIMTADAVEGGFLHKIICEPAGTNVATIVRVFINNGSTNATAANNTLVAQIGLPASTLSEVAVATMTPMERVFNIPVPPGYKINVVLATAAAAGWHVTAIAGDY